MQTAFRITLGMAIILAASCDFKQPSPEVIQRPGLNLPMRTPTASMARDYAELGWAREHFGDSDDLPKHYRVGIIRNSPSPRTTMLYEFGDSSRRYQLTVSPHEKAESAWLCALAKRGNRLWPEWSVPLVKVSRANPSGGTLLRFLANNGFLPKGKLAQNCRNDLSLEMDLAAYELNAMTGALSVALVDRDGKHTTYGEVHSNGATLRSPHIGLPYPIPDSEMKWLNSRLRSLQSESRMQ